MPDVTKPPMLTYHHWGSVALTFDQFYRKCPRYQFVKWDWQIYLWKYLPQLSEANGLTHWRRVSHICGGESTITGSDNGLSLGRRQAIIWSSAGVLLIWTLGTNFNRILIGIQTFSIHENAFENVVCEMTSICLGLNGWTEGWKDMNFPGILLYFTKIITKNTFVTKLYNTCNFCHYSLSTFSLPG